MIMKTLLEALIGRRNIKNASSVEQFIPVRKSNLKDGDICLSKDGWNVGMYISRPTVEMYILAKDIETNSNEPAILFFNVGENGEFTMLGLSNYDNELKEMNNDSNTSISKIVRGLFDPDKVKNVKEVKRFLMDDTKYSEYFE